MKRQKRPSTDRTPSATARHGRVVSVNISRAKGTVKRPVGRTQVTRTGIAGDAHAGPWHRQVSLLASEDIAALSAASKRQFRPGEFAENITTSGLNLADTAIGDRFLIGRVELEVTQIGKECHGSGCAIFREVGKCVMPKQGIFTRVLRTGAIKAGDRIELRRAPLRAVIVTLSDRASRGEYEDRSGPAIRAELERHCAGKRPLAIEMKLLPDNAAALRRVVRGAVAKGVEVILTTGGTGIGSRDITPETIRPLLDKEIPGIMEFIRVKYGVEKPSALLSRSVAGVIGRTLVYTLPGSVRGATEYMSVILQSLDHALLMLRGLDAH